MTPGQTAAAVAIGAVVGVLPGLFGVGGGFLMVPLLYLGTGVPITVAVGSCASQTLGSTTTGLLHRREHGELFAGLAAAMLPGTLIGLRLGIGFLEWTKTSTTRVTIHGRDLPLMEITQLGCYLAIMLLLAAVTAVESHFTRDEFDADRRGWLEGARLPPYGKFKEIDGRPASLPLLTLIGLAVGFLNGGFGMGGAILLVPSLVFLVGVPTHRAVAVTLFSSWISGLYSVGEHAFRGNVELRLVCWLLLGGTIGSHCGAVLSRRLTGRKLRRWFSLVILASTAIIVARLWQLVYG